MATEKKEQTPGVYDEIFAEGGYHGSYDLHYKMSPYYPMYKKVLTFIRKSHVGGILEIGCGTGAFARMVMDTTNLKYQGFDFSPVAIKKSGIITGEPGLFHIGDATKIESYPKEYEAIACTEVLEHIPEDLRCIEQWKKGAMCFCSVPNYDSQYHVRFFNRSQDVYKRYGELLDIQWITKVKKPVLSNLSLTSYLQYIRWNRFRPKRLLAALGLGRFQDVGGWFVFVGIKK